MRMDSMARLLLLLSLVALCAAAAGAADSPTLVEALKRGDRDVAQQLLRQGVDVNAASGDGSTALHWAVRMSDVTTTETLLRRGANVNVSTRLGITPLMLAAENGDARLIALLLRRGAVPNTAQPRGVTALMMAARAGKAEAVTALLEAGAAVGAVEASSGETALMWAASRNNAAAVEALIKGGANADTRSTILTLQPFRWETDGMLSSMLPRGGWTALMYAAREGARDAAEVLVRDGADANVQDPDGTTPLVIAIENAHFDLARSLLDHGANPNLYDVAGMGPLFAAVDMHTLGPIDYRSPPVMDDETSAIGLITALLDHGAAVDARLKGPVLGRHIDRGDRLMGAGSTPLMRAAKTNDIPVMKQLVERGADPFALQDDLTSVLMIAAQGGRRPGTYGGPYPVTEEGAIQAVTLCLEWGLDVNAFNTRGETALYSAATRNAPRLIQLLADHGARFDMKTLEGRSVLDAAKPRRARRVEDEVEEAKGSAAVEKLVRDLIGRSGAVAPAPAPSGNSGPSAVGSSKP